jgi:hypothetical protein
MVSIPTLIPVILHLSGVAVASFTRVWREITFECFSYSTRIKEAASLFRHEYRWPIVATDDCTCMPSHAPSPEPTVGLDYRLLTSVLLSKPLASTTLSVALPSGLHWTVHIQANLLSQSDCQIRWFKTSDLLYFCGIFDHRNAILMAAQRISLLHQPLLY